MGGGSGFKMSDSSDGGRGDSHFSQAIKKKWKLESAGGGSNANTWQKLWLEVQTAAVWQNVQFVHHKLHSETGTFSVFFGLH